METSVNYRATFAAVAALAMLAGCAPPVDDPANPANLGHWKVQGRLDAVSVNSMNIGRDMLARQGQGQDLIRQVEVELDKTCVEPSLNDDEDLLAGVESVLDDCEMTNSEVSGSSRHAEMSCKLDGDPVHAVLDMSLAADSGTNRVRVTVAKPKPTGGEDRMAISYTQTLSRIGDCS